MAIDTTRIILGSIGQYKAFIDDHTTPGTGANQIKTGAGYVIAAIGCLAGTPDKTCICTPNTSDHSTAALGSYCLEAESDLTAHVLVITAG